ncbi:MAG: hypothetical protein ACOY40_12785 [Bacillota bacterium]
MAKKCNGKVSNGIGREIFIKQLELMKEYGKTVDFLDDGDKEKLKPHVEAFAVPEELVEAFYAYYKEFLSEPGGCTNICGPFFNDEDVKGGVWSKFYHFYMPAVNMVNEKYPELRLSAVIDPSYNDTTQIIVIAENNYGCIVLSVPVVALNQSWKAWHVPFDDPDNSESVYADLEEIYDRMDGRVLRAMVRPYIIVQLEGGVLADTWISHGEEEAVALAGKIAGERCRDDDDDVLVELPAGTDIHAHSTRIWSWGGGEGD